MKHIEKNFTILESEYTEQIDTKNPEVYLRLKCKSHSGLLMNFTFYEQCGDLCMIVCEYKEEKMFLINSWLDAESYHYNAGSATNTSKDLLSIIEDIDTLREHLIDYLTTEIVKEKVINDGKFVTNKAIYINELWDL